MNVFISYNSRATIFLIYFFLVFNCINVLCNDEQKAKDLLNQMMVKNKEIKSLEYSAYMHERINGKFIDKNSFFKINISPQEIYLKQTFIGITVEGLYIEGLNNNQLLISSIGFPWLRINLDPRGSRVRKDHHHTIFDLGFDYFTEIIDTILKKYNSNLSTMLSYEGLVSFNNHECHKITIQNDFFHYNRYTVKSSENLTTIANKFYVNDYMILEKNPEISNYTDVKPGQLIWVPSDYAQKLVLYLDADMLLPLLIEIYDEKGLYATYAYINLVINPTYKWNEFSPTFKEYHFR
jgi:hypothetical protein